MNTFRNRVAWRLCTWALAYVADDTYGRYIGGAIRYGMTAAARDVHAGRDPLTTPIKEAS